MTGLISSKVMHTPLWRTMAVLLLCAVCLVVWLLAPILAEPFTRGEFPLLVNGLAVFGVLSVLERVSGWLVSSPHPG